MKKVILALSILLLFNIPSVYYSWYITYNWVDVIQHLTGGFFIAMLFSYYLKDHFLPGKKIQNTLIIVGATIFIGVVWEFAEYIANQTLIDYFYQKFQLRVYFMGDLRDTIKDLLDDILGGLTFCILSRTKLFR